MKRQLQWEEYYEDGDSALYMLPTKPIAFELSLEENVYSIRLANDRPIVLGTFQATSTKEALQKASDIVNEVFNQLKQQVAEASLCLIKS